MLHNKGTHCRGSPTSTPPPAGLAMEAWSNTLRVGTSSAYKTTMWSTPWIILWIFMTLCLQAVVPAITPRKNVLLIIADDMRPQFNMYKDVDTGISPFPKMFTPNLDELASKSLVFQKTFAQMSICNPSRSSLLTSRRSDTTKVYDSHTSFRDAGGDFTTMPQYFKENGYVTLGMGKIFHPGRQASNNDDPQSWSNDVQQYYHPESEAFWRAKGKTNSYFEAKYGSEESENLNDELIANKAIETLSLLQEKVKEGKNFFLAVGFKLPHLPFVVPSQYLQYYPLSEIQLPATQEPPTDMPNVAWFTSTELREYEDIKKIDWFRGASRSELPANITKNLRQYYYASVTYVDHWVGQVLKALEDKKLSDNTIVLFFGDHGYHLGENGLWTKNTNYEIALQVPLMIHVPGLTKTAMTTNKLVELIDVYPTLVELAGLSPLELCSANATITSLTRTCREGSSFRPLFDNPDFADGKQAAFSQIYRASYRGMGYTVRTAMYRYTEWVRFNKDVNQPLWDDYLLGTEFYNHMVDPNENFNLANGNEDMSTKILIQQLSKLLREGWRSKKALPKADWTKAYENAATKCPTLSNMQYLCLYLVVLAMRYYLRD